jgi:hypothetical protein
MEVMPSCKLGQLPAGFFKASMRLSRHFTLEKTVSRSPHTVGQSVTDCICTTI